MDEVAQDGDITKSPHAIQFEAGGIYRRLIPAKRKGGAVRHELWRFLCVDAAHDELVFKKVSPSWDKVAKNAFIIFRTDALAFVTAGTLASEPDCVRPRFMSWDDEKLNRDSPKALVLQRNCKLDDETGKKTMQSWLGARDSDFGTIKQLVTAAGSLDEQAMLVRAYSPRHCAATVAKHARMTGQSQQAIKRLLHKYAWFGMGENALLRLDASKGATGPLSRNNVRKSGPRDAAHRVGGEEYAVRPRNADDLPKFLYALTHFWVGQHKTLRQTYLLMKETLYVTSNQTGVHRHQAQLIPTERMFRYAAATLIRQHRLRELRAGHKDALDSAPRGGYDTDIAPHVGSVFDIDGTPFNKELVCRYKVRRKRLNIGKPYVVLVFDRKSKKCVGWHVYLGNENWKEGYLLHPV